jgi:hypothetical protein
MITLDMLGFDCLDDYLARRMTAAELAALTTEQKRERRRAQHRVYRARRSERLVALPAAESPSRSERPRALHRDWLDTAMSVSPVDGRARDVLDVRGCWGPERDIRLN